MLFLVKFYNGSNTIHIKKSKNICILETKARRLNTKQQVGSWSHGIKDGFITSFIIFNNRKSCSEAHNFAYNFKQSLKPRPALGNPFCWFLGPSG